MLRHMQKLQVYTPLHWHKSKNTQNSDPYLNLRMAPTRKGTMASLLNVVRPNTNRLSVPSSMSMKYSNSQQQISSSSPFVSTTYLHGE